MTKRSRVRLKAIEQPVADATEKLANANERTTDILFGAQRLVLDEMLFISSEMLDRMTTEMHLATEFVSKMAQAHSVKNIRTLSKECGQHQIDSMRREAERFFKHGERVAERVAALLGGGRIS
jgi:FtsZ-binding cell division protein ZapB